MDKLMYAKLERLRVNYTFVESIKGEQEQGIEMRLVHKPH